MITREFLEILVSIFFFAYIPIFKIENDSALENGGRQSNTSGLPLFNKTHDPPSMVQKRNTQTKFFFLTPSLSKPIYTKYFPYCGTALDTVYLTLFQ